ncbi:cupin domain-containing protein [Ramlibacter sp. AW1]|uniref:Cupin domain-containing protein n=1 Tax=Ramlibacter aurantiacus TaxID=2801330 RepID=A0A936ZLV3_9BURK|nr:cupin domain-containing protein [Ramlibacter aurantiacus]MBL0420076.1 cupin domain-containing protein [Ramlibacter aurantiacus]
MDYDSISDLPLLVERLAIDGCTPGWVRRRKPLLWARPQSTFEPAHWSYARLRPALLAACRLIGTDEAERRNLILRNPAPGVDFATTNTLVGAYQAILPGEQARSHRHAPHALRVILEAEDAWSVVNGVRHPMNTGDIVLTPGQHWHGHGHDGTQPALWFDCLDVPLVHLLEPMRFEDHPAGMEPVLRTIDESPMRWRAADIAQRLAQAREADTRPDAHFGLTVDLSSPALPTIAIRVHAWDTGWGHAPYRHAANELLVVLGGRGTSRIGEHRFDWGYGDVLALPMGTRVHHQVHEAARVVSLSDDPVMRLCGYYFLEGA